MAVAAAVVVVLKTFYDVAHSPSLQQKVPCVASADSPSGPASVAAFQIHTHR